MGLPSSTRLDEAYSFLTYKLRSGIASAMFRWPEQGQPRFQELGNRIGLLMEGVTRSYGKGVAIGKGERSLIFSINLLQSQIMFYWL